MQFELTEALLDDILFSMEDQEEEFYVDTRDGLVIDGEENRDALEADNENRFLKLPLWDSSRGFRLMERFTASLRNPLIQNELSAALNQGKGVFRAFKNTLGQYPVVEKRWFSFKEREMKQEIIRWYNALREAWGLEKIGLEPEETGDLVLEDFRFREFRNEDKAAALELHRICTKDDGGAGLQDISAPSITVESADGVFVGYLAAEQKDKTLSIHALEIKSEYRGLGLGKALLARLMEQLDPSVTLLAIMDLPAGEEAFSRVLLREGFVPRMTRYCLTLQGARTREQ